MKAYQLIWALIRNGLFTEITDTFLFNTVNDFRTKKFSKIAQQVKPRFDKMLAAKWNGKSEDFLKTNNAIIVDGTAFSDSMQFTPEELDERRAKLLAQTRPTITVQL